jgi:hypothetical protein
VQDDLGQITKAQSHVKHHLARDQQLRRLAFAKVTNHTDIRHNRDAGAMVAAGENCSLWKQFK